MDFQEFNASYISFIENNASITRELLEQYKSQQFTDALLIFNKIKELFESEIKVDFFKRINLDNDGETISLYPHVVFLRHLVKRNIELFTGWVQFENETDLGRDCYDKLIETRYSRELDITRLKNLGREIQIVVATMDIDASETKEIERKVRNQLSAIEDTHYIKHTEKLEQEKQQKIQGFVNAHKDDFISMIKHINQLRVALGRDLYQRIIDAFIHEVGLELDVYTLDSIFETFKSETGYYVKNANAISAIKESDLFLSFLTNVDLRLGALNSALDPVRESADFILIGFKMSLLNRLVKNDKTLYQDIEDAGADPHSSLATGLSETEKDLLIAKSTMFDCTFKLKRIQDILRQDLRELSTPSHLTTFFKASMYVLFAKKDDSKIIGKLKDFEKQVSGLIRSPSALDENTVNQLIQDFLEEVDTDMLARKSSRLHDFLTAIASTERLAQSTTFRSS